jgi:hypothetical protein
VGAGLEVIGTDCEVSAGEIEKLGLVLTVRPADRPRPEARALAAMRGQRVPRHPRRFIERSSPWTARRLLLPRILGGIHEPEISRPHAVHLHPVS